MEEPRARVSKDATHSSMKEFLEKEKMCKVIYNLNEKLYFYLNYFESFKL